MTMHILQLGPYPPPEGGVSRNMLAIRAALASRGHKCSIIATAKSNSIDPEPDVYHPRSAAALLSLLRSLNFDVLHLHVGGDVGPRVLALIFAASFFGRGKNVLTLHSGAYPLTDEARRASPNSIRGRIFRRFSRIIGVNEQLADVFRRYGVGDERISVIPAHSLSAPDTAVTVPGELADFRRLHSPMLLAVGGLEKDYDPLFQIAAMKDIVAEYPDAGLMIVGGGSMQQAVATAVAASGLAGNICITGNVDHAVVLHLINDADAVLRTTLFDGDAISVREALFLGTPVVATNNAMRPAGVHLIPVGDTDAFLRGVRTAITIGKYQAISAPDGSNIDAVIELYQQLA